MKKIEGEVTSQSEGLEVDTIQFELSDDILSKVEKTQALLQNDSDIDSINLDGYSIIRTLKQLDFEGNELNVSDIDYMTIGQLDVIVLSNFIILKAHSKHSEDWFEYDVD